MLKVWNLSMVVGAFALTTFGTFLTRGSILTSVHAFAKSAVGPLYLGFLVLVLTGGFGLIAARAWRLRSEGRFDSALSREAVFLGNNLILLSVTFVVLLGTIFPLLYEALTNRQVTVGGPYFRSTTTPLFLLLLFLVAVGPLLPWRRAAWPQLRKRLLVPAVAGAAVIVALAVAGIANVAAVGALGLAAFVATSNVSEMVRGVRAHAAATGRSLPAAVTGVFARNRRLYGGLVAHLGLAIAAAAITVSSSFAHQTEVSLVRGQQTSFAGYTLTYQGEHTLHQPQREVLVADVAVTRGGRSLGELTPSVNLYPGTTDPIGTPSIHFGVLKDLYASLVGFDRVGGASRGSFRFFLNPGVLWLWVGGGIMALGGLLAAWPERRRRRRRDAALSPVERTAPEAARVREVVS